MVWKNYQTDSNQTWIGYVTLQVLSRYITYMVIELTVYEIQNRPER